MNNEEIINILKEFEEKRIDELPENAKKLFYAIMKIADERDELENIRKEQEKELESWKKKYGEI